MYIGELGIIDQRKDGADNHDAAVPAEEPQSPSESPAPTSQATDKVQTGKEGVANANQAQSPSESPAPTSQASDKVQNGKEGVANANQTQSPSESPAPTSQATNLPAWTIVLRSSMLSVITKTRMTAVSKSFGTLLSSSICWPGKVDRWQCCYEQATQVITIKGNGSTNDHCREKVEQIFVAAPCFDMKKKCALDKVQWCPYQMGSKSVCMQALYGLQVEPESKRCSY
jgi:hypothetical protein